MTAKKTILLIVDDWEAQERYEDHLAPHLEVTCAPFAKTGLECIVRAESPFDFILVDLAMEDVSPLEFMQRYGRVKKSDRSQIVVILDEGGHDAAELNRLLRKQGVLVPRPFQWTNLLNQYFLMRS